MAVANQCPAAGSICRITVTHGVRSVNRSCGASISHVFFTSKQHRLVHNVLAGRERVIVYSRRIGGDTAESCVSPATSFSSSTILQAAAGGCKSPRMLSAEELARVQVPVVACSFPSMLHPHYRQVRAQSDDWIESVAELPSAAACRSLRDSLLPCLVCRFIPRALPGRRLLHAIKFIAWLMIADEDDDHPGALGSDYASTSHRADRIMAILTSCHRPADTLNSDDHSLISKRSSRQLAALADLWQDMCTEMSPLLRSRLTSSMADYLEGNKIQATLRNQGLVPDVDSYMEIRHHASFTVPAFIIAEYASGIELDQATCENALVVDLQKKAVDYISLCNDIFSCYKEICVGDYFNLPSILYTCGIPMGTSMRPCLSFQDAINHANQLAQGLDAHCNCLITSLHDEYSKSSIDPRETYQVYAYLNAMASGMSGALAWFFETPRYPQPCMQDQLEYYSQ